MSTDPEEKTLGIWLHRFSCNDDGVKNRARATCPPDDFRVMLQAIASAPDARQVRRRRLPPVNTCTPRPCMHFQPHACTSLTLVTPVSQVADRVAALAYVQEIADYSARHREGTFLLMR